MNPAKAVTDWVASQIRTIVVPGIVAVLATWAAYAHMTLNPDAATAVTGLLAFAYWLIVRLLERKWPKAGWLLLFPVPPSYTHDQLHDLFMSARRTFVPLAIGAAATFLDHGGLGAHSKLAASILTMLTSGVFYGTVRAVEHKAPSAGLLIGGRVKPTYLMAGASSATVAPVLRGAGAADYSFARPSLTGLKSSGIAVACRYLSWNSSKNLQVPERDAGFAAGLYWILNWEASATDALGGWAAGAKNATEALRQATNLGYDPTLPIIFSVDFDENTGQDVTVLAYLAGAASIVGKSRVGVYGEIHVVDLAVSNGYTALLWQTRAWSGGKLHPQAHLYQQVQLPPGLTQFQGQIDYSEVRRPVMAWAGVASSPNVPTPDGSGDFPMSVITDPALVEQLYSLMGLAVDTKLTEHLDPAVAPGQTSWAGQEVTVLQLLQGLTNAVASISDRLTAMETKVNSLSPSAVTPAAVALEIGQRLTNG